MKAKRPGLCIMCDERFEVGAEIAALDVPRSFESFHRTRIYKYKWGHKKCVDEENADFRKRIAAIGGDDG